MKFLKNLANGMGAGIATAVVGVLTGNPAAVTLGVQLTAGGVSKATAKATGRGWHRIVSPALSIGVAYGAHKLGVALPVDTGAEWLDVLAQGALGIGAQAGVKSPVRATQDFVRRRVW